MNKIPLLLALIILLSIAGSAQTPIQKMAVRVFVQTQNDEQIKNDVRSYLGRELRSLGDVEVSDNATIELWVTVLKTKTESGQFLGYAVSYRAIEIIYCGDKTYFNLIDSGILIGNTKELRGLCEDVVTGFDAAYLDKKRSKTKPS